MNYIIFETISKNTEKSISHIDVYRANVPKWTCFFII
jgi:hypothetical protein